GGACVGELSSRHPALGSIGHAERSNGHGHTGISGHLLPHFFYGACPHGHFQPGGFRTGKGIRVGSTLPRRALGRELRKLRERAGVTRSSAARIIEVSPQSIGRIEDGQGTRLLALQVNALCDYYRAEDEERRTLLELLSQYKTAQRSGGSWWRGYAEQLAAGFDHYLSLEDAADRVTAWKLSIVPGLLQTPDYRRALAWAATPEAATETIESQVAVAMRRQGRLDDTDFTMNVLLAEGVLHDQVGGPGVLAG